MKTPAGRECRFYYEDFHRGRNKQECRLLKQSPGSRWKPSDCADCPVPEILWANASENLALEATVKSGVLGFGRHVAVTAYCTRHHLPIPDPYVGCAECARDKPSLTDLIEEPHD